MMSKGKYLLFAAGVVAVGCGGGSGGGSNGANNDGPENSEKIGSLDIRYQGKVGPMVGLSSGSISVAGLAGASISSLIVNPAKTNSNSLIAFGENSQIYTYSPLTLKTQQITSGPIYAYGPVVSRNGKIAYVGNDSVNGPYNIFTCNADGSNTFQVTKNAVTHNNLSWSPDATKIIFNNGSNQLFTVAYNGGVETNLGLAGVQPVYNPAGTKIAYIDNSTGALFIANANGTSPARLTGSNYTVCSYPCWSADGTYIIFIADNNIVETTVSTVHTSQTMQFATNNPSSSVQLSPDNLNYVFTGTVSSTSYAYITKNSANSAQYNTPLLTANVNAGSVISSLNWSGFFGNKTFVGTNGALGTTASGFLCCQYGTGFGSLVTFNATTPSTMKIVAETTNGDGAAPIFSVTADKLTSMNYINGYYNGAINSVQNVPSALVSFDPSTGQIATLAPFAATKGVWKPIKNGGITTFHGAFTGVFDAKGKNIAPGGSSSVSIDTKTGRIVRAS